MKAIKKKEIGLEDKLGNLIEKQRNHAKDQNTKEAEELKKDLKLCKNTTMLLKEQNIKDIYSIPDYPHLFEEDDPNKKKWENHKLIPLKGTRSVIGGHPGVGKSVLALQMAASIATGISFLGKFKPTKQGRVVYICAEDNPLYTHVNRFKGFNNYKEQIKKLQEDIYFIELEQGLFIEEQYNGTKPSETFLKIKKECEKLEPVLIVIDPLGKAFGLSENDNTKINQVFMNHLRTLHDSKNEPAIIEVTHLRKSDNKSSGESDINSVRGAGAIVGDAKCFISLDATADKKKKTVNLIKASYAKDDFKLNVKFENNELVPTNATECNKTKEVNEGNLVEKKATNKNFTPKRIKKAIQGVDKK